MPTIELRDYQSELVSKVRDQVSSGYKKVLMVLPTGGGKTYICADIATRSSDKGFKVLCLMHRRQLVNQMVERFADYGLDCGVIMSGEDTNLSAQVQIATIQTYHRRLKIREEHNPFFVDAAIVIIDEAHRSLSKTYQETLSKYEDKIVIGVTATPCLSSGVGMGEYYESLVDHVGVSDLVASGNLVPARYYAPTKPDLDNVKIRMGDYEKKALGEVMNQKKLIGDVFTNWIRLAGGLQTIVFAVNVKHSKALCKEFLDRGVKAEHLDAHNDDETRSDTLRRFFDGDTQVICNVGLFQEGFDCPGAVCAVLARPTKSMGLYRQMCGRVLRPDKGKDEAVIIDHGGCVDKLGFVEDDVDWTLNGKSLAWRKRKVRKKEKHIMTCEYCSEMFTGKRCPNCGREVKGWTKKIEAMDAELVEVKGSKKKAFTKEEKRKWYGMLEYYRRMKSYSPGWVAHKYREKIGCWPRGMDNVQPIEPDNEVRNWILHGQIKYAKSKKRKENKGGYNYSQPYWAGMQA